MLSVICQRRQEQRICDVQVNWRVYRGACYRTCLPVRFRLVSLTAHQRDLNKLFEEYDVRDSIDSLHAIINEATKRKARGEKGEDVWREDVQPHQAVSARTVPRLQAEMVRLQERLETVCSLYSGKCCGLMGYRWKPTMPN